MFDVSPTLLAIVHLFVAYFVLTSALAVWAGLSRWHIGLRCGVVLAWLALWIPAQVDDLGWYTLVEAALIISVGGLMRWFAPRTADAPPRMRFQLKDLLIAVLLVGVLLWIVRQLRHEYAPALVLILGTLAAFSTLCAAWLIYGRRRFSLRLVLFVLVQVGTFCALRWITFIHEEFALLAMRWDAYSYQSDQALLLAAASVALGHGLWLTLMLGAARAITSTGVGLRFKQVLAAFAAALSLAPPLVLAGWLFSFLAMPLQPPDEPYPNPNHYPELRTWPRPGRVFMCPKMEWIRMPRGSSSCGITPRTLPTCAGWRMNLHGSFWSTRKITSATT